MNTSLSLAHALQITPGDVVAFVGGGGKTTAMFQLANELAAPSTQKMRVLTTTSTRIFAAQIKRSPAHVTFDPTRQTIADILPHLNAAINTHGQVLLIGKTEPDSGKAFGVESETIDALAATGYFDVILNEADGSRMRPFKAPANHEPVISSSTTIVVPMVGLDTLNQPLTDENVHRAALVSQLSHTPLNTPITPNTVATVIGHPQGGLKNVPPHARVVPLLNKVDTAEQMASAREIAKILLDNPRIDTVLIGATQNTTAPISEVWGRTAAIILAAGGSSRFGSPKQLAHWQGQTFIERVADVALASQSDTVTVVLGAEVEQCRAALADRPVEIMVNKDWAAGQSTSMQVGLAALPQNISNALFLLVDQPGVTPDVIDALIERQRHTLAPIVWPEFEGKRGNPILFHRSLFPQLAQISGDTGGKPLLLAHKDLAECVAVTNPNVLLDFDHPEDLAEA